jgi:hypothetical protein
MIRANRSLTTNRCTNGLCARQLAEQHPQKDSKLTLFHNPIAANCPTKHIHAADAAVGAS